MRSPAQKARPLYSCPRCAPARNAADAAQAACAGSESLVVTSVMSGTRRSRCGIRRVRCAVAVRSRCALRYRTSESLVRGARRTARSGAPAVAAARAARGSDARGLAGTHC